MAPPLNLHAFYHHHCCATLRITFFKRIEDTPVFAVISRWTDVELEDRVTYAYQAAKIFQRSTVDVIITECVQTAQLLRDGVGDGFKIHTWVTMVFPNCHQALQVTNHFIEAILWLSIGYGCDLYSWNISVCTPDCRNNLVKNKVSVEDDARYKKSLGQQWTIDEAYLRVTRNS